jgi:hypothetical protein
VNNRRAVASLELLSQRIELLIRHDRVALCPSVCEIRCSRMLDRAGSLLGDDALRGRMREGCKILYAGVHTVEAMCVLQHSGWFSTA